MFYNIFPRLVVWCVLRQEVTTELPCRKWQQLWFKYFYAFKYDTSASAKIQNLTRYYCEHYQRSGLARLSLSLRHSESPTQFLLNNATKPQMFNRTCKCCMLNVESLTRRRNGRMREVVNKIGDFRHWHWHKHQLTSPLPGHWAMGRVTGKSGQH